MKKTISLIFLSLGCLILLGSCSSNHGKLFLINKSKDMIVKAYIHVDNQLLEFENIMNNEKRYGSYQVTADSHFDVEIEFKSGNKIKKSIGYITHGFDYKHKIVIDEDINIYAIEIE